ncbi:ParB/RepB/Spo0J family partition protein [Streptomyces sp. J2-1]|uniref:ParB/RepB/Spo0J family partition protein n=1 Tax=Streptomyces corallincola TaxID=2851888 RepID=UPI001C37FE34|nr:ParB/RepB/Spo0J family partition protein [Streptomyces corallincola]MBV2353849.1 ParB/RepB/Spo0J family partition protein [Streptomyces corallincola]
MSKADQLGAGRFGGGVRPVSARRQAVAAATGVPTDGVAPPTELPPHRISPNPDNPRSTLGDLTDLAGSLRTHGQKQAITVMNRDAYIKVNPGREADLEADAAYVVIDGSSRLAAAREAGLVTLKVMVSDEQGTNAEELLESALVANIHRQDLEELDEARALQRLLGIHGSQTALAKRLHRSQGWVSQRLALLNLTPELQQRIGQEPIDLLRAVGNKPHDQQETALEELKAERLRKEAEKYDRRQRTLEERQVPRQQTGPGSGARSESAVGAEDTGGDGDAADAGDTFAGASEGASYYDVIEDAPEDAPEDRADEVAEVVTETVGEGSGATAPVAATTSAVPTAPVGSPAPAVTAPQKLPYDNGTFVAMHLIRKMSDVEFDRMLQILNDHQRQRTATADSEDPAITT